MKILHIAPLAIHYCKFEVLENCQNKKADQLIQDNLMDFYTADLVIIDANYCSCSDNFDCEGIKLLKWIRLNNIHTHCIIYSSIPEIHFQKNDKNKSILLSRGVTFVHMPQEISEQTMNFNELIEEKSPDDLSDFFLSDYLGCLAENRHFHANWWGPMRIMEYLKRKDGINGDNLCSDVAAQRMKDSYQGLVLRYVKSVKENSIWEQFRENLLNQQARYQTNIQRIDKAQTVIKEVKLSPERGDALVDVNTKLEKLRIENEEYSSIIESKLSECPNPENFNSQILRDWDTKIEVLRGNLKKKNPQIRLLDDMSGCGWSFVIQQLIYGKQSASFGSWIDFVDQDDDNWDEIAELFKQHYVDKEKIDLLIMDLRLQDEKGEVYPCDLSGIKLLRALRKTDFACPILVMSATKNPETVQEVFNSGADAFWRKEGIDENNNPEPQERVEYTLSSIYNLLRTINTLCDKEYKLLYGEMLQLYVALKSPSKEFWWENAKDLFQKGPDYANLTREKVAVWVARSFHNFKNYLSECIKNGDDKKSDLYCDFALSLLLIVETIHYTNRENSSNKKNELGMVFVRDWGSALGEEYYQNNHKHSFFKHFDIAKNIRNQQAHRMGLSSIDFENFHQFITNLSQYITELPREFREQINHQKSSNQSDPKSEDNNKKCAENQENPSESKKSTPQEVKPEFTGTISSFKGSKNIMRGNQYYRVGILRGSGSNIVDSLEDGTKVNFNLTISPNYTDIKVCLASQKDSNPNAIFATIDTITEEGLFIKNITIGDDWKIYGTNINEINNKSTEDIIYFAPIFNTAKKIISIDLILQNSDIKELWAGTMTFSENKRINCIENCSCFIPRKEIHIDKDWPAGAEITIEFPNIGGVFLNAINVEKIENE